MAFADITLAGRPGGSVRGIVRGEGVLLFFIETGTSLDIYAIAR